MNFAFPKKKIGESVWFLNEQDFSRYGKIMMITIAIKETDCTVWYAVKGEDDQTYTVNESQLAEDSHHIPVPKFSVGDTVNYNYQTGKGKIGNTDGVIERIQVLITDQEPECVYYMDDDPEFWVLEHEIVGLANPVIDMTKIADEV